MLHGGLLWNRHSQLLDYIRCVNRNQPAIEKHYKYFEMGLGLLFLDRAIIYFVTHISMQNLLSWLDISVISVYCFKFIGQLDRVTDIVDLGLVSSVCPLEQYTFQRDVCFVYSSNSHWAHADPARPTDTALDASTMMGDLHTPNGVFSDGRSLDLESSYCEVSLTNRCYLMWHTRNYHEAKKQLGYVYIESLCAVCHSGDSTRRF